MTELNSAVDVSRREVASTLWPTYALRAWLTALLAQVERTRDELDTQVEAHEKEIALLNARKKRSEVVIRSLREAAESVDNVLRAERDMIMDRTKEAGTRPSGSVVPAEHRQSRSEEREEGVEERIEEIMESGTPASRKSQRSERGKS